MVAFSNVCMRVLGNAKAIDIGGEAGGRASLTVCFIQSYVSEGDVQKRQVIIK